MPKRVVALALLALLTACGGGGGAPENPNAGTPGILPTGSLTGEIVFLTGVPAVLLENEPNDALGEAQFVGDLPVGGRLTILGQLAEPGDEDPMDGFRIRLPQRAKITATVTVEDPAGNDFDLGVYDPVSLQFVETFPSPDSPHASSFHGKGVLDLVMTAVQGAGAYEILLRADVPATAIREREPNDVPGQAQFVGEVLVGDRVVVDGAANPATDATDAILITCPAAQIVSMRTTTPAFATFGLRILDATADLTNPVPVGQLLPSTDPSRTIELDVPAGTLLHLEMATTDQGGEWRLTVEGKAASVSPKAAAAPLPDRVAPLRDEATRLGRGSRVRYGRATAPMATGEALVRFLDGEDAEGEAQIGARSAKTTGKPTGRARRVSFEVPEGIGEEDRARYTLSRIAALSGSSAVRYCEPNYIRVPLQEPDDTYYSLQWHYPMLHLPEAWDLTTGDEDVIVAVIDTGRTSHPDLAGRQSGGYDMISNASIARDGDGYDSDPTDTGDLAGGSSSSWHGTHVAGTIGASSNDGRGVSGVTWASQIMHVRALGLGGGTVADIANAVRYAAGLSNDSGSVPAARADVINMSLGGGGYSQTMADACEAAWDAGVVIFASAGNGNTSAPSYPAAYPDVISVMAVDLNGNRAPYSNWGSGVELAAPGGDATVDRNGDGYADGVLSTIWNENVSPPQAAYTFYQGTSMACPHAVGVAALMLAVDPTLTPSGIRLAMRQSADDLGSVGRDDTFGYGLVNAYKALVRVGGAPPPADPILSVSPASLNFGSSRSSLDISIVNLGGGLLNVGPYTVETLTGDGWLSATLLGPADASRTARTLRVRVDRFGLLTRTYLGKITLGSNAGTVEIPVAMGVVTSPQPPPYLDIHIKAIRADTGEIVGETSVNPAASLKFSFPVLPIGDYIVIAGTDLDSNGVFCEEGDYCGAWPLLGEPEPITVIQNNEAAGVNFQVIVPTTLSDKPAGR